MMPFRLSSSIRILSQALLDCDSINDPPPWPLPPGGRGHRRVSAYRGSSQENDPRSRSFLSPTQCCLLRLLQRAAGFSLPLLLGGEGWGEEAKHNDAFRLSSSIRTHSQASWIAIR